jgi:hypothetical protein
MASRNTTIDHTVEGSVKVRTARPRVSYDECEKKEQPPMNADKKEDANFNRRIVAGLRLKEPAIDSRCRR